MSGYRCQNCNAVAEGGPKYCANCSPITPNPTRLSPDELRETLDRWETQAERGWLDKDELKSLRGHIASLEASAAQARTDALEEAASACDFIGLCADDSIDRNTAYDCAKAVLKLKGAPDAADAG